MTLDGYLIVNKSSSQKRNILVNKTDKTSTMKPINSWIERKT